MRLPRVRFTVRRLMIVVAVIAILIGVGLQIRRTIRLSRLSAYYAKRAAMYAESESTWRKYERWRREREEKLRKLANDPRQGVNGAEFFRRLTEDETDHAKKLKTFAEFRASMKAKYGRYPSGRRLPGFRSFGTGFAALPPTNAECLTGVELAPRLMNWHTLA
jgi:hypothetical protein